MDSWARSDTFQHTRERLSFFFGFDGNVLWVFFFSNFESPFQGNSALPGNVTVVTLGMTET